MKIGVIGATGFIGKVFCQLALEAGHEVVGYSRKTRESDDGIEWRQVGGDLSGLDAVVNFAGESVAQRWTVEKKVQFATSRVDVTRALVKQISEMSATERPKVLVNSSAVGYYGDCGDRKLDERSEKGDGFLSDLCLDWENAAYEARALGVRVVIGRVGLVLGAGGAAWEQMKLAFKLGAGGNLGSGKQWMPWVHVDDVALGILYSITNEQVNGVVNLVSPEPLRNSDFTKQLASQLFRPALIPAPSFALQLVFGEFGKHLLDSYRAYPTSLLDAGYQFSYPTLQSCLEDII